MVRLLTDMSYGVLYISWHDNDPLCNLFCIIKKDFFAKKHQRFCKSTCDTMMKCVLSASCILSLLNVLFLLFFCFFTYCKFLEISQQLVMMGME